SSSAMMPVAAVASLLRARHMLPSALRLAPVEKPPSPFWMKSATSFATWPNTPPKLPPPLPSGAAGAVGAVGARAGIEVLNSAWRIGVVLAMQQALHHGILIGHQVAIAGGGLLAVAHQALELGPGSAG